MPKEKHICLVMNVMASMGKPLEIALADGISRRHGGVLGIVFN